MQAFDDASPEVAVKKELLALGITRTLLVAARGKRPPRACEDHRPYRGICLKSLSRRSNSAIIASFIALRVSGRLRVRVTMLSRL